MNGGAFAAVLGSALVLAYYTTSQEDRHHSRALFGWLCVLAFFAVVIDMVEPYVERVKREEYSRGPHRGGESHDGPPQYDRGRSHHFGGIMRKHLAPLLGIALVLSACSGGDTEAAPAETTPEAPPTTTEPSSPASEAPITAEPLPSPTPSQAPDPTPPPPAPTQAAPPPPAGTETSLRGNLVKQVGERAGIRDATGEYLVSFTVNTISVDIPCTEDWADPPQNGHFVALDVSVETSPNMLDSDLIQQFSMSSYDFDAIKADGFTSNAGADSTATLFCLADSVLLPSDMGPGQKAHGIVLLDVEDPSGVLIYEDYGTDSRWEYSY